MQPGRLTIPTNAAMCTDIKIVESSEQTIAEAGFEITAPEKPKMHVFLHHSSCSTTFCLPSYMYSVLSVNDFKPLSTNKNDRQRQGQDA